MSEHQLDDRSLYADEYGTSLHGVCSHCQRTVDNHNQHHRVTSIIRGGKGVECVLRGDITYQQACPMGTKR